jgi:hypothetical protein
MTSNFWSKDPAGDSSKTRSKMEFVTLEQFGQHDFSKFGLRKKQSLGLISLRLPRVLNCMTSNFWGKEHQTSCSYVTGSIFDNFDLITTRPTSVSFISTYIQGRGPCRYDTGVNISERSTILV